ncbi:TPA: type II secretion system protein [Salmonella enterica subsp. enterica serovar Hvittingfoss]|nr:type II secretion system protein [Salmonella enterica subsp. enterica serovar Hvittingfoss]
MVSESVKKKVIIDSRGFSLLEVLIVLVFIGIILVTATNYARKMIDEKTRQTAADAVAQEIYGVLQFINAGSITATVNNVPKKIINPLYQQSTDPISEESEDINTLGIQNNPLWLAHPGASADATNPSVSPYIARSWSKSVTTPISNQITVTDTDNGTPYYSHSLKWSQAVWGQDSVREDFTDSRCADSVGNIYFNQQFLSCDENPVLRNSEIAISRLDLVSAQGTVSRTAGSVANTPVGIDRVDVYISFIPVDNHSARIEQFITPLMAAFRLKKITPDVSSIYLVRQLNHNDNSWTLLDKTSGQNATSTTPDNHLALFSDLPDMIDKLQNGQVYGIRFSFNGKGEYLRTDGLNSATKVCWDTGTGTSGPCLTSPSQDALVLKRRDNPREFANLQVGNIILKGNTMEPDPDNPGSFKTEYYTAPQVQYASFSQSFDNKSVTGPFYIDADKSMRNINGEFANGPTPAQLAEKENGAILIPVQQCPVVDEWSRRDEAGSIPDNPDNPDNPDLHRLYPRLSASVSSLISGLPVDESGNIASWTAGMNFNRQSENLTGGTTSSPSLGNLSINRLGGVILQITSSPESTGGSSHDMWHISSMVATEGIDTGRSGNAPKSWQYYNPAWLSVVVTTWCSSVEQK